MRKVLEMANASMFYHSINMCLRGYGYLYFKRIYKAKTVYYVFSRKQYMYIWAIDQV